MPLTNIVTIVLRLFSLSWLVQAIVSAVGIAAATAPYGSASPIPWYLNYGAAGAYFVMAVAVWLNSPLVSRIVTPRPDTTVSIGGLTRYDLYCFAFVFIGLYFILSSIGSAINWIHYYAASAKNAPQNDPERISAFYQLTQALVPLLAGVTSIAMASRLAKKLTVSQRKYEERGEALPPTAP